MSVGHHQHQSSLVTCRSAGWNPFRRPTGTSSPAGPDGRHRHERIWPRTPARSSTASSPVDRKRGLQFLLNKPRGTRATNYQGQSAVSIVNRFLIEIKAMQLSCQRQLPPKLVNNLLPVLFSCHRRHCKVSGVPHSPHCVPNRRNVAQRPLPVQYRKKPNHRFALLV